MLEGPKSTLNPKTKALPWIRESCKKSKLLNLNKLDNETVEKSVVDWVESINEGNSAGRRKRSTVNDDQLIVKKLNIPWKIWLYRLLKAYIIRRCVISTIYVLIGLLIYLIARFTSRNHKKYNLKYVLLRWPVAFLRVFSALGDDVNGRV